MSKSAALAAALAFGAHGALAQAQAPQPPVVAASPACPAGTQLAKVTPVPATQPAPAAAPKKGGDSGLKEDVGASVGGTVGQAAGGAVGGPIGAAVGAVLLGRVGEKVAGGKKDDGKKAEPAGPPAQLACVGAPAPAADQAPPEQAPADPTPAQGPTAAPAADAPPPG